MREEIQLRINAILIKIRDEDIHPYHYQPLIKELKDLLKQLEEHS